jgi:hypothetical protein
MILKNGSAQVLLNLKKPNKQSLKIDPGTHKKLGMSNECNKTIAALHSVQYDVLWSTEKQY